MSLFSTAAQLFQSTAGIMNTGFGYLQYRSDRKQGVGMLPAFGNAIWQFGVLGHPAMIGLTMGFGAARYFNHKMHEKVLNSRLASSHFGGGVFQDNELTASSRASLYQSALTAGQALSMSGRSWAGNEALIMHRRYQ